MPGESSDARWSLRLLDGLPRIQELPACSHATCQSPRAQEKTRMHTRTSADSEMSRASSPSTHHKTDAPSQGRGRLPMTSPTHHDLARHSNSKPEPCDTCRSQHSPDAADAFPQPHTLSMMLFSTPPMHHIRTTIAHDETRGVSSLAKLNELSRSQLHSDDSLRDATLLAHLHAPFLSTYGVPEPPPRATSAEKDERRTRDPRKCGGHRESRRLLAWFLASCFFRFSCYCLGRNVYIHL